MDVEMTDTPGSELEIRSPGVELRLHPGRLLPWNLMLVAVRPLLESPESSWVPTPMSRDCRMLVTPGAKAFASHYFDLLTGNSGILGFGDQFRESGSFSLFSAFRAASDHDKTSTSDKRFLWDTLRNLADKALRISFRAGLELPARVFRAKPVVLICWPAGPAVAPVVRGISLGVNANVTENGATLVRLGFQEHLHERVEVAVAHRGDMHGRHLKPVAKDGVAGFAHGLFARGSGIWPIPDPRARHIIASWRGFCKAWGSLLDQYSKSRPAESDLQVIDSDFIWAFFSGFSFRLFKSRVTDLLEFSSD
jgi:hypothetical protein